MKYLMIAFVAAGLLSGCGKHDHSTHAHGSTPQVDKVKDPVCLMEIDKAGARTETHNNQTFYFCSQACQDKFKAEPAKYVK